MIGVDEDNYKEAIDASFKVFAPRGISKNIILWCISAQLLCQVMEDLPTI